MESTAEKKDFSNIYSLRICCHVCVLCVSSPEKLSHGRRISACASLGGQEAEKERVGAPPQSNKSLSLSLSLKRQKRFCSYGSDETSLVCA